MDILLFLLFGALGVIVIVYNPSIDITKEKDVLLWYWDKDGNRRYFKLWKK